MNIQKLESCETYEYTKFTNYKYLSSTFCFFAKEGSGNFYFSVIFPFSTPIPGSAEL